MTVIKAVRAVVPKWTQGQFAQALGTDQGTVSRLLRNDGRRFTFEQLAMIEDAAGIARGTILAMAGYVDPTVAELAASAGRGADTADAAVNEARRAVRERRRGASRSGPSETEPPQA